MKYSYQCESCQASVSLKEASGICLICDKPTLTTVDDLAPDWTPEEQEYQIVNIEPLYVVRYMEEENTQSPSCQEHKAE